MDNKCFYVRGFSEVQTNVEKHELVTLEEACADAKETSLIFRNEYWQVINVNNKNHTPTAVFLRGVGYEGIEIND